MDVTMACLELIACLELYFGHKKFEIHWSTKSGSVEIQKQRKKFRDYCTKLDFPVKMQDWGQTATLRTLKEG